MPTIAANLTMLFTEYPFLERFDRAAAAGFTGVEFLFPYGEKVEHVYDAVTRNDLNLVLFNLPAGDWDAGDRGIAVIEDRQEEFRFGIFNAVQYGAVLQPSLVNCLAGKTDDPKASRGILVDNIITAAEQVEGIGARLTVEPVNTYDAPGFAIPTTDYALEIIAETGHTNVGLQFDIYHSFRMDEDPVAIIRDKGAQIAHIQIADLPDRHQPGTGTVNWEELFETIDQSGYNGWVSLEYVPQGRTEDGFGHLRELGVLG
jgi:hydroxypyruvate isomerase